MEDVKQETVETPVTPEPEVVNPTPEIPLQPEVQPAPVEPVAEVAQEETVQEVELPRDQGVCVNCKGEGLVGDPAGVNSLCVFCGGTGKVA